MTKIKLLIVFIYSINCFAMEMASLLDKDKSAKEESTQNSSDSDYPEIQCTYWNWNGNIILKQRNPSRLIVKIVDLNGNILKETEEENTIESITFTKSQIIYNEKSSSDFLDKESKYPLLIFNQYDSIYHKLREYRLQQVNNKTIKMLDRTITISGTINCIFISPSFGIIRCSYENNNKKEEHTINLENCKPHSTVSLASETYGSLNV